MIYIYKNLILKYIKELKPSHIKEYAKNNNIDVTDQEIIIIYNFLINNYERLLENDNTIYLLKDKLRPDLFIEINNLYQKNINYLK